MNQTIEEIKRRAKEYQAASLGRNQLATDCLWLIAALEKCRLQRDDLLMEIPYHEDRYTPDEYNKELEQILEGKKWAVTKKDFPNLLNIIESNSGILSESLVKK